MTDILILGGGLNGAALAAALKDGPHSVLLLEPHPPFLPSHSGGGAGGEGATLAPGATAAPSPVASRHPPPTGEGENVWDARIYAYSPGNVEWIKTLGGWNDAVRAQAVHRMRIHGDDGGRLSFDALDAGLPELAWIAENSRLQYALWQSFAGHPNVRVLTSRAEAVTWGAPGTAHRLHLADGETIQARLLVAADGAHSWLRDQAGIGFDAEDYRHIGVVANFATERPHRGTAFQWFRADGVLAWLPLQGQRISMVWSTPPEHAAELQALPHAELARRVAAAGAHALGELRLITPPAGFPLVRRRAHEWVRPGLALLGDTAHTVHPLAGQGVNLGFRDSRLLAQMLKSGGDPGEIGRLTSYAARRFEDVASMQFTTGALKKLFARPDGLTRTLRNLGLDLADRIGPLNQALTRHAIL
ncbi:MAG: FAD-dependent monooxygenase [Betaproteobacteria bacterium]|nr:FAD-dependent monooxygenase [Betaproteobacteria bacterium]